MKSPLFRLVFILLSFYAMPQGFAQNWMSGYTYRKKITINKNKVYPGIEYYPNNIQYYDLVDFPVLIEIEDEDLIHVAGSCGNKIQNMEGRDVSFALSTAPDEPLNFQIDSYHPATGKLTCWVKIHSVSANMTTSPPTSIYLYYGSDILHDPYNTASLNVWTEDYTRVWHMEQDSILTTIRNAASDKPEESATGDPEVSTSDFTEARFGKGIKLNGISESFSSAREISTAFTISAWIRLAAIGTDQVIVTNDSLGTVGINGYCFKVNAAGKLTMELFKGQAAPYSTTAINSFLTGTWYFVTATSAGNNITLYINGIKVGSKTTSAAKLGSGGTIKIGSGKQNDQYFNGIIDELRIQKTVRKTEWVQTEYANQHAPADFYSVFAEEYNPSQFSTFTGTKNTLWNLPANWREGIIPGNNANVVITAGKTVQLQGTLNAVINRLILEDGAVLSLSTDAEINCAAQINKNAAIKLDSDIRIRLHSDVINNGSIELNETTGTLVFCGNRPVQYFSGSGVTKIAGLENDQTDFSNTLLLQAPVQVTGFVELKSGILNANSYLSLLADPKNSSASLLPVQNLDHAQIVGNVNVQTSITGNYPSPSTARGWRLLASPVYTSESGGFKYYNINALKNSMFITGAGGVLNGFDPSPLNGGTIYTHDQSLPGNLTQKYTPIFNTDIRIPFGKGIFVFSRGNRSALNAFNDQIQSPPFSNPDAFNITYTGQVQTGDLRIELYNRDNNEEGDGFNLVGNPYPCRVKWGSLLKNNLTSFVWLYDPKNNSYIVSDDPETTIPSGSGFFVKVNSGQKTGSLLFSESSKYVEKLLSAPVLQEMPKHSNLKAMAMPRQSISKGNRLNIKLGRESLEQQYTICFETAGSDEINDNDAVKIGEGFVSIAGLNGQHKLSIDHRPLLTQKKEINLYVKGWETGFYDLTLKGIKSFDTKTAITLEDHFLNTKIKIPNEAYTYRFLINTGITETQGANRFTLVFDPNGAEKSETPFAELKVYPNPFSNQLFLKTSGFEKIQIIIYDLTGRIISRQDLTDVGNTIEIGRLNIKNGIYLLEVLNKLTNKIIGTFKIKKI